MPDGYDVLPPVVVCISDRPEERARMAALFEGAGVLVIASSADEASAFLGQLQEPTPVSDPDSEIRVGDLRIDRSHYEARWRGRPLRLTPHELTVLSCLASRPGRVWTYHQLHDAAWEGTYFTGRAAVQSVVKRLRAKLREAGVHAEIDAARGLGFRLSVRTELHVVPQPTAVSARDRAVP
jgi:DNA-binding response OmpR family regulator